MYKLFKALINISSLMINRRKLMVTRQIKITVITIDSKRAIYLFFFGSRINI